MTLKCIHISDCIIRSTINIQTHTLAHMQCIGIWCQTIWLVNKMFVDLNCCFVIPCTRTANGTWDDFAKMLLGNTERQQNWNKNKSKNKNKDETWMSESLELCAQAILIWFHTISLAVEFRIASNLKLKRMEWSNVTLSTLNCIFLGQIFHKMSWNLFAIRGMLTNAELTCCGVGACVPKITSKSN